jgi:hypothetical protein
MSAKEILMGAASLSALPLPVFVSSSVARVSTSSNTVTAPTGIQDGDLLVAVIFNSSENADPITLPSGWSMLFENDATNNYFVLARKTAASESGNYTFGFGSSTANTIAILVYRNATQINTTGTLNRQASTATGTASSIAPTFRGSLCAFFANETARTVATAPSGMTQRADQTAVAPAIAVYDSAPEEALATGDRSIVWSGTGTLASILFQVTNEPTVAPEFVASASQQNTSDGATLTIGKPAGTVEGDLMVAVMACSGGGTTWTGDTDWIEVAEQGADISLRVAYKVAGGSENLSYTFTNSSSIRTLSGTILTYRYAAYDTTGTLTTSTDPLILPSISPSESQSILIAAGARGAASLPLGTPTRMTARVTDNDATSPSCIVCDQTVAKGPTGTRFMTTGSTSNAAGIMLAIKPTRSL